MISILCPTRKRPDNILRLINSINDTASEMPEVIFYVDEDDDTFPSQEIHNHKIKVVTGPRIVLSQCWNECYKVATGDILMLCGDDIVFKTKGWDSLVEGAFYSCNDKILFVHGDDCIHGDRFGTHGFIHRKWAETVGYFVPPYFSSDYNDTWLNDVSNSIGCRLFIPFVTEHMHFGVGKGEKDQTHIERLERHERDKVEELYIKLTAERERDISKLRAVMLNGY